VPRHGLAYRRRRVTVHLYELWAARGNPYEPGAFVTCDGCGHLTQLPALPPYHPDFTEH